MKSNSIERPLVFHNLGNGSWHYNYNLEEVEKTDEDGSVVKSWDYQTVQVWGTPTEREVKKLVIAENWDLTEEINLQNGNKRFELGLSEDTSLRYNYIAYLETVDSIKTMVDSDFEKHADLLK